MTQALIWKNDSAYPLTAPFLSRQLDVRPGLTNQYLVVNAGGTGVIVKANTIIPLLSGSTWKCYNFSSDSECTTLDTGSLTLGTNYYLYICDDGSDAGVLLLSANSTAPNGYTSSNSRKIGGFHYGRKRNSITVSDVTSSVVLPNSVWDLCHRPRCTPEGMAYIGNGLWVDIYLPSVDETITFNGGNGYPLTAGTAKSAYNVVPLSGTEGLSGYNFIELARRSGKRLLTLTEWLQAAHGSPQGNNADNVNAWSATTNGARANTGSVINAISFLNIVDCVGNLSEWVDEYFFYDTTTAYGWFNPMSGQNVGQLYSPNSSSPIMITAGGSWGSGVYAGSRCIALGNYPWAVLANTGSRFACDSL